MRGKILTVVAMAMTLATAQAQTDESELPAVHALPCIGACANSSAAVGISEPKPSYPGEFINGPDGDVEGFVLLHYKINADGHVSDIALVESIGPKKFADITVNAVKNWVYKPATLDGKPVATCWTMQMRFAIQSFGFLGARPAIMTAYEKAIADLKNEKWDDAQPVLTDAMARPKINLYEYGMMANVQSLIAMHHHDFLQANWLSVRALDIAGKELPGNVRRVLLETRAQSDAALGDMVGALDAGDQLKAMKTSDTDAVVKFVEDARIKADAMQVFGTSARIPDTGETGTMIGLYRRNFAFANVKGSLDRFTLSCKQQAIESKVSETAEWHVPASWSDCHLLVYGAPGTTFKIAQALNAA